METRARGLGEKKHILNIICHYGTIFVTSLSLHPLLKIFKDDPFNI